MWLLAATLLALPLAWQPPEPPLPPGRLTLVTWNLRFASWWPPHAWWQRRDQVLACLQAHAPDLIATQEALPSQIADLRRALPSWQVVGRGRDLDGGGEQVAVLVRKDRFDVLAVHHAWLSPTPDVPGSVGYGNRLPRMVTRVHLRDRTTGRPLVLLDTHLDHGSVPARERAAAQLAADVTALGADVPVLLAGDFNTRPLGPVHARLLAAGLRDAWQQRGAGPGGTFHRFIGPRPSDPRIDWVLIRGFRVLAADVLPCAERAPWPSDHAAVRVVLEPEPAAREPEPSRPGR